MPSQRGGGGGGGSGGGRGGGAAGGGLPSRTTGVFIERMGQKLLRVRTAHCRWFHCWIVEHLDEAVHCRIKGPEVREKRVLLDDEVSSDAQVLEGEGG